MQVGRSCEPIKRYWLLSTPLLLGYYYMRVDQFLTTLQVGAATDKVPTIGCWGSQARQTAKAVASTRQSP
jgi:bacteriorhodopsin